MCPNNVGSPRCLSRVSEILPRLEQSRDDESSTKAETHRACFERDDGRWKILHPKSHPMQHEKETKKRVENELLTKPEKRLCSTRCLYNTFRQDGSHETEEDRKVLGRGRTSGLALLRDRRRAGCS